MNKKRDKEKQDNLPETEEEPFKRSRKLVRSPVRNKDKKDPDTMEEKIDNLTKMMMEFMREMKTNMRGIKEEMSELKNEITGIKDGTRQTNEKMEVMQNNTTLNINENRNHMETLQKRNEAMEIRLEKLEKDRIRNNIVLTGMEENCSNLESLKARVNEFYREDMGVAVEIESVYRVGEKRCVIRMNSWEDKMKVMKNKHKLKGGRVFVDSDQTPSERKIMKHIREKARAERENGKTVKVGYMKLMVDGREMRWNAESGELTETETLRADLRPEKSKN